MDEVSASEIEAWSGTDRSTRFRRWWYAPDGLTRWDELRTRVETRLVFTFGREWLCGCQVLTKRRLRAWCLDHLREHLLH